MTAQMIRLDIDSPHDRHEPPVGAGDALPPIGRAPASVVRLVVSGEVDIATAPELDQLLSLLLDGGHHVEIDCAALSFIDVAGSRMIAGHLQAGSRASLHSLQPNIERTFRLVGLGHLVPIRSVAVETAVPSESQFPIVTRTPPTATSRRIDPSASDAHRRVRTALYRGADVAHEVRHPLDALLSAVEKRARRSDLPHSVSVAVCTDVGKSAGH